MRSCAAFCPARRRDRFAVRFAIWAERVEMVRVWLARVAVWVCRVLRMVRYVGIWAGVPGSEVGVSVERMG